MQTNENLQTHVETYNHELIGLMADKKLVKQYKKQLKTSEKRVFLIGFDNKDKECFEKFKRDVDTVILNATNKDKEVYITIQTPGGSVTAYADAATQIQRLKDRGFNITCFVDEIAASGGYMMACVANKIVAQKMAFVGSIGVVSQMPNVEEALKKLGIVVNTYTAGTHKRTVVPTKTPTAEEEKEYKEKLLQIHDAFKKHVSMYRPQIDTEMFMQGDFYLAQDVVDKGIVDEIGDSKSAILDLFYKNVTITKIQTRSKKKKGRFARLIGVDSILEDVIGARLDKLFNSLFKDRLF